MNVQIQSVNFDIDTKLTAHIQKKIEKLNTFHDKITHVEVYLKLDSLGQKIKDKIAEIKVNIPSVSLFAKHESKVFEESFDLALDSMVAQIKKNKEKSRA
jgi:putative sigma-54 modulation protein